MTSQSSEERFDVAIIGMSGRFPGAHNLKEFWNNLAQGVESIRAFSDEELFQRGVDPECVNAANYVKAASVLEDSDHFAASFFGYSPREAELLDPQHRLFLECAWEAIEDAGYAPRHLKGTTGVYAGASLSSYMLFNLAGNPAVDPIEETFQVMVGGDKDFLSTRLSYKLNLKGPSLTVQTGCSTSLVALHMAVQNLLTYQCDIAITGGVSIGVPQRTGYFYQPGGIASPDGHCRPFDAEAQGTIFGEGIGVAVLKRMEEALADGDHIYAVIRGSAINNDGSGKIGYTAPGIEGQADVITRAHALSGVTADSISYIEAHGTATALGDPVEITALHQAFANNGCKPRSCAIGSLKSNIGHLDAAAGITGLMKIALMLKHRRLVPTLHFRQLNPKIDLANSPFYVNTVNQPWTSDAFPLRAGVSSFGIGGTNAHAVLEEAPTRCASGPSRPLQLICLSADTEAALSQATANLADHLEQNPAECLADVAYTLHSGREQLKHRRAVACADIKDAVAVLRTPSPDRILNGRAEAVSRGVVFMFPGGGTQYVGMGGELYRNEPVFRREMDECAELLKSDLGYDIRNLLYCSEKDFESSRQKLLRPSAGLPAIFATEYAVARLFMSWGVKPVAMIGHSLGEYAAACLAGVFSLNDALRLVLFRGRMFELLATGAMMSVNLPEGDLGELPAGVSIAAINTPDQCVISGPTHLIEKAGQDFSAREVEFHRLHIEAAAHCSMVEPVMEQFLEFLRTIPLARPTLRFISNLTGKWVTDTEATAPHYWVRHLRHTVRFSDGLQSLAAERNTVMLEIGPGRTLASFVRQQLKDSLAFSSMRHPHDTASELLTTCNTLGRLWSVGAEVDWQGFYQFETRNRVPLPTYPFERQSYWIAPPSTVTIRRSPRKDHSYFYRTIWNRVAAATSVPPQSDVAWMILCDEYGLGEECSRILRKSGSTVFEVKLGAEFAAYGDGKFTVNCTSQDGFRQLIQSIPTSSKSVNVIHLWTLSANVAPVFSDTAYSDLQEKGLYSLLYLSRAVAQSGSAIEWRVSVVSNGMADVSGADTLLPEKSSLLAACIVIPQECHGVFCNLVDVDMQVQTTPVLRRTAQQIIAEKFPEKNAAPFVTYRGTQRWVRDFEPLALISSAQESTRPAEPRVYLLTGGLGKLGLLLARHLAEKEPCRFVFTTRSAFPERKEWSRYAQFPHGLERITRTIEMLMKIEESGSEVWIRTVDVSDHSAMEILVQEVESCWADIYGVIHLAGITGDKALRLISDITENDCQAQFRPKIGGCCVLDKIFRNRPLQFCALFSSTASLLGGPGMLPYTTASCFLDSFAANAHRQGWRWFSINWDGWVEQRDSHFVADHSSALDRYALPYAEALSIFDKIVAGNGAGQIIVSSGDLAARIAEWSTACKLTTGTAETTLHVRPSLSSEYVAPKSELQKQIAAIWSEVLHVDSIGIHDNLFELGGNSLIGLRIVARLKKDLSIEIPVTALFEGPTVSTLSQLIESKGTQENYNESRRRGELRRSRRTSVGVENS